jgi:hypothetical protein
MFSSWPKSTMGILVSIYIFISVLCNESVCIYVGCLERDVFWIMQHGVIIDSSSVLIIIRQKLPGLDLEVLILSINVLRQWWCMGPVDGARVPKRQGRNAPLRHSSTCHKTRQNRELSCPTLLRTSRDRHNLCEDYTPLSNSSRRS